MRRFTRILLLAAAIPILRVQAIHSTAAAEANATSFLADSVLRILVLGDSVAAGSGDESGYGIAGRLTEKLSDASLEITNAGIPGARVRDVLDAITMRRDTVRRSDVVVLSIGGNDLYGSSAERLWALLSPDHRMTLVAERVQRLVDALHRINPAARIILLGLYNPYARTSLGPTLSAYVRQWDGNLMLRFAANRHVTVLQIADLLESEARLSARDRFHPGVLGYAAIATRIAGASIFEPHPNRP